MADVNRGTVDTGDESPGEAETTDRPLRRWCCCCCFCCSGEIAALRVGTFIEGERTTLGGAGVLMMFLMVIVSDSFAGKTQSRRTAQAELMTRESCFRVGCEWMGLLGWKVTLMFVI